MANRRTNVANAYETELTAPMGPEDLSIQVEDVFGVPSTPCYLVIDPMDPAKREYIYFDGTSTATSFSTSTIDNRYLPNSAATGGITHDAGAVVRMSPMEQHIDDLNDRIDTRLQASSHTKSQHDGLGLDHNQLSNLTSGDPHTQYHTSTRHENANHNWLLRVTPAGTRLHVGSSPPSSPSVGDLWVETPSA